MEVETSSGKLETSLCPKERLVDIIESSFREMSFDNFNNQTFNNELIKCILEKLEASFSSHKHIVSISNIETTSLKHLNMTNAMGASWNSKKDGFFVHHISDPEHELQLIATLIWIS